MTAGPSPTSHEPGYGVAEADQGTDQSCRSDLPGLVAGDLRPLRPQRQPALQRSHLADPNPLDRTDPDNVDARPDVTVGRLPAHSASEVTSYVDKVAQYEGRDGFRTANVAGTRSIAALWLARLKIARPVSCTGSRDDLNACVTAIQRGTPGSERCIATDPGRPDRVSRLRAKAQPRAACSECQHPRRRRALATTGRPSSRGINCRVAIMGAQHQTTAHAEVRRARRRNARFDLAASASLRVAGPSAGRTPPMGAGPRFPPRADGTGARPRTSAFLGSSSQGPRCLWRPSAGPR